MFQVQAPRKRSMPCTTMRPEQRMISVLRKEMYSYCYSRGMKSKSRDEMCRGGMGVGKSDKCLCFKLPRYM